METNSNTDKGHIERETLQLVLEEFTQEQKTSNQHIGELIIAVKNIENKIDVFKMNIKQKKMFQDNWTVSRLRLFFKKVFWI